MKRIRIIHRLRLCWSVIIILVVIGLAGLIGWANHTGLPESWRNGIENALAANGIHTNLSSLRYHPTRGIVANEVTVYTDASRERVLGHFHRFVIATDMTKLFRGDVRIERIDLSGASISLPANPEDPESKTLDITELNGRIELPGKRALKIADASGMIGGIRLALDAELDLYRSDGLIQEQTDASSAEIREQLVNSLVDTLEGLDLETQQAPQIHFDVEGDFEDPSSFRAEMKVQSGPFRSRDLEVTRLGIEAEYRNATFVVHRAAIETSDGELAGEAEYELQKMSGRIDMRSSLDLTAILENLRVPLPDEWPTFKRPPALDFQAFFHHNGEAWDYRVVGHAELYGASYLHYSADRLQTSFSCDGTHLLLEDLELWEGSKRLNGRFFISPGVVRYQATANLPLPYIQDAVRIQPLSTVLNDFGGTEETETHVVFEGHATPGDKYDWSYKGHAEAWNISYRGVPSRHAKVDLDLSHGFLDFNRGEVEFDYDDYAMRKKYDGPASGNVTVDQIRYDNTNKTVIIRNLKGTAWPAPIIRTFAAEVADNIESYGFHGTPSLEADGTIAVKASAKPKQNLLIQFSSDSPLGFEFLDQELTLTQPSGNVRVLSDKVRLGQLKFGVFGGTIRADLERAIDRDRLGGELDWTRLELPEISEAYELKSSLTGKLTGRINFELADSDVSGLNGKGHVALEQSKLYDVPMFGPLSPLIAAVLGTRKASFQEASDAFMSFDVDKGVVSSNDFITTTSSLNFTGDGKADLNKQTIDMTVRMNARGFLGLITLPLKPFYGLFQFRGTGPIENPEWNNVAFTSPPADQKSRLIDPPRARAVPQKRDGQKPAKPSETEDDSFLKRVLPWMR